MAKELSVAESQKMMEVAITQQDIKNYFCPLATEKELYMALGVIKSLSLNPFTREVHLIKYNNSDKLSIVVGYEVYLKRAERTGLLDGWKCGIDPKEGTAWVEICRKDWKEPFRWEISLSEFDKKQSTWKQMPTFMGKKVAIAQGFRLAFPDQLGGMPYTQEEVQVYDIKENEEKVSSKPQAAAPAKKSDNEEERKKAMLEAFEKEKERLGEERFFETLGSLGYESPEQLTVAEGEKVHKALRTVK